MNARACLILALMLSPALVSADDGFITTKRLEPNQIAQLDELLQKEMDRGGRFEFVKPDERETVTEALAEMQRIVDGKASIAALDEDEKVALINAQERANAILTKRDGDRLICTRQKKVGSNMKQTTCETYREQVARTTGSRDQSRQLSQPKSCISNVGGEAGFCPSDQELRRAGVNRH